MLPQEPCITYFQEFSKPWMHDLDTDGNEQINAEDNYQGWPVRVKEVLSECGLLQNIETRPITPYDFAMCAKHVYENKAPEPCPTINMRMCEEMVTSLPGGPEDHVLSQSSEQATSDSQQEASSQQVSP